MRVSKLTKTNNLTSKLKALQVGDSVLLELRDGVPYNDLMKSVTATCCRLKIKVKQTALKGLSLDFNQDAIINIVKVARVS